MRLLQAAQVMSLLGTVVLEAEASALHAQGVKVPAALNGVIAFVSSLNGPVKLATNLGAKYLKPVGAH